MQIYRKKTSIFPGIYHNELNVVVVCPPAKRTIIINGIPYCIDMPKHRFDMQLIDVIDVIETGLAGTDTERCRSLFSCMTILDTEPYIPHFPNLFYQNGYAFICQPISKKNTFKEAIKDTINTFWTTKFDGKIKNLLKPRSAIPDSWNYNDYEEVEYHEKSRIL